MVEFRIDEKDKKILIELQKNSRLSFSSIGKAVNLPKTVIAYRIKRLVDSGFIDLFSTIINKEKLGYVHARLFLKFHNFNEEIEKNLLTFLEKRKNMHWVASLNGCYDFCIILLAKNMNELSKTYSEIIYRFNKYILDKELSITTEMHHYQFSRIFGAEKVPAEKQKSQTEPKSIRLDDIDLRIINSIKQNSRIPLLEISEKLKLSPQTARVRMKELIKNNIIQGFRIRLNYKMLGFHHFHCFLNLTSIDKNKEEEIIEYLSSLPSTIQIVKGTGKYDLEFESILQSHFELFDTLKNLKNKFPQNIQHTDSVLIYEIYDVNTVRYE
jgi:Lrp/AsnC family leucine-responsive transcriptional regulator